MIFPLLVMQALIMEDNVWNSYYIWGPQTSRRPPGDAYPEGLGILGGPQGRAQSSRLGRERGLGQAEAHRRPHESFGALNENASEAFDSASGVGRGPKGATA